MEDLAYLDCARHRHRFLTLITSKNKKSRNNQVPGLFNDKGWKTGFEPATSGTTIQRSNQLSYNHHLKRMQKYFFVLIQPNYFAPYSHKNFKQRLLSFYSSVQQLGQLFFGV